MEDVKEIVARTTVQSDECELLSAHEIEISIGGDVEITDMTTNRCLLRLKDIAVVWFWSEVICKTAEILSDPEHSTGAVIGDFYDEYRLTITLDGERVCLRSISPECALCCGVNSWTRFVVGGFAQLVDSLERTCHDIRLNPSYPELKEQYLKVVESIVNCRSQ
jgi:hypothetical protein